MLGIAMEWLNRHKSSCVSDDWPSEEVTRPKPAKKTNDLPKLKFIESLLRYFCDFSHQALQLHSPSFARIDPYYRVYTTMFRQMDLVYRSLTQQKALLSNNYFYAPCFKPRAVDFPT